MISAGKKPVRGTKQQTENVALLQMRTERGAMAAEIYSMLTQNPPPICRHGEFLTVTVCCTHTHTPAGSNIKIKSRINTRTMD